MPKFIEQLGQQVGGQAAQGVLGGAMGMVFGKAADRRAYQLHEKVVKRNEESSKELTNYNMLKQLELWKATNYSAQMEELKQAGLNPGLLYGMSGGGGATANVATGTATGSASRGNEEAAVAQTMMSLGLQRAQKENIEADTEKKKVEATKLAGVDTEKTKAETTSITQGVENQKAQQKLTELQQQIAQLDIDFQTGSLQNRLSTVNLMLSKLIEETQIMGNERLISDATVKTKIGLLKQELANKILESYKTKAETANIEQATLESINRIHVMLQENMRKWDQLSNENQHLALERLRVEYETGGLPKELKDLLGGVLVFPTLGRGGPKPITGFHNR